MHTRHEAYESKFMPFCIRRIKGDRDTIDLGNEFDFATSLDNFSFGFEGNETSSDNQRNLGKETFSEDFGVTLLSNFKVD